MAARGPRASPPFVLVVRVWLTPVVGAAAQALSVSRTTLAGWGKPKPMRATARTATRSLVKKTEASEVTSTSSRTMVSSRLESTP